MARARLETVLEAAMLFTLQKLDPGLAEHQDPAMKDPKEKQKSPSQTTPPEVFRQYARMYEDWFRVFTWRRHNKFDLESFVMPYMERNEDLSSVVAGTKRERFKVKELDATMLTTLVTEILDGDEKTPDFEEFISFLTKRVLPYYLEYGKSRRLKISHDGVTWSNNELNVECTIEDVSIEEPDTASINQDDIRIEDLDLDVEDIEGAEGEVGEITFEDGAN